MGTTHSNEGTSLKTWEKEYFDTINKMHRLSYQNNRENSDNVYMSKLRKEFATSPKSNKPQNEAPMHIHWLDYVYDFLYKQCSLGALWPGDWIILLDKEDFLYENKYQSLWFFWDFYLRTFPKCLRQGTNNNDIYDRSKETKTNKDHDIRCTSNTINISNNKNYNELSVTSNWGGSFLSMNTSELKEHDPIVQYKKNRKLVKEYITEIKEEVFNNPNHPIRKVIHLFSVVFTGYWKAKTKELNQWLQNSTNEKEYRCKVKEEADRVTKELQKFIIKMQKALRLFYCQCMDYECFSHEKDELMNLMTGLVFKTGKIYENMFELYQLSWEDIIKGWERKCNELHKVKPEEWGILEQFCWNDKTLVLQNKILIAKNKEKAGKVQQEKEKEKEAQVNKTQESQEECNTDEHWINQIQNKLNNIAEADDCWNELNCFHNNLSDNIQNQIDELHDEEDSNEEHPNNENGNKSENILRVNVFISTHIKESLLTEDHPSNKATEINYKLIAETSLNGMSDGSQPEISTNNNHLFNAWDNKNNFSDKSSQINQTAITSRTNTKTKFAFKNTSKDRLSNVFHHLNNNPRYSARAGTRTKLRELLQSHNANFNVIRDSITRKSEDIAQSNLNNIVLPSYISAIQLLQSVKKFKTPFEKMMIIATISDEITECISDFWKDMNTFIEKSFLGIESDQLMIILLYIIIKSQMPELAVHVKMIKNFTTTTTRGTMIGYYYTTLEATIAYLEEMKDRKEFIRTEELQLARWSVLNLNNANRFTTSI